MSRLFAAANATLLWSVFGAFVWTGPMADPAHAANLLATDPASVLAIVQSEGFVATLGTDDVGDPKIDSRVSDTTFTIFFYGCEAGKDCLSVQLSAGYDLDSAMSATKINEWNRENRYTRAFIDDDGDPFLRMDVMMREDGIGAKNFVEVLDTWRRLVEDFEGFVGW